MKTTKIILALIAVLNLTATTMAQTTCFCAVARYWRCAFQRCG